WGRRACMELSAGPILLGCPMWTVLLLVGIAGALGGLLNSLVGGITLLLPQFAIVEGSRVIVPGFLGNVLVGAIAAVLSYALYGSASGYVIATANAKEGQAPAA